MIFLNFLFFCFFFYLQDLVLERSPNGKCSTNIHEQSFHFRFPDARRHLFHLHKCKKLQKIVFTLLWSLRTSSVFTANSAAPSMQDLFSREEMCIVDKFQEDDSGNFDKK